MIFAYCILALIVAPLGPAAQNIFSGLLLLAIGGAAMQHKGFALKIDCRKELKHYLLATAALLACFFISDCYWQYASVGKMFEYLGGHLSLIIFPLAGAMFLPRLSAPQLNTLKSVASVVMVILALVCCSQFMWGWQWRGMQVAPSEFRARGFYSHPLTLAYAASLLLPLWTTMFLRNIAWRESLGLGAILTIVLVSKSRVIQLVTLAYLGLKSACHLQRRPLVIALSALCLGCSVLAFTDNPIRENFRRTLQGNNDHEASSYADDRVLFWHAHLLLALDSPLIGHSPHAPATLRDQKYAALGFANFSKKYSAHNTFLQMIVDGGVLALLAFAYWIFCIYQLATKISPQRRLFVREAAAIFLLSSLTQNAWQDIEVRFILSLLLATLFIPTFKHNDSLAGLTSQMAGPVAPALTKALRIKWRNS